MNISEARQIKFTEEPDDELPYRVEIVGVSGSVFGAAVTPGQAITAAFSASGMWPNRRYPERTADSLKRFIFWNFGGGENWVHVIKALGG